MRVLALLMTGFLTIGLISQASAGSRVALIIGNSAYQHVPKLANPDNDAEAIALLLNHAGFDVVVTRENLGIDEMRRAVRDFSEKTADAEIAVMFYAGHGMEVRGINYLVPIDATLRRDIDVEDETISLDRVLQVMEPAKRLRLVILDACRDNPFLRSMKRTMVSRAIGRGLARVEPSSSETLIAFAAKAGSTAADGEGANSPFTTALLKHLVNPGLDIRLALGRARDDVLKATTNRQEPFVYGSLGGDTVTLTSLSEEEPLKPTASDPDGPAARDYEATARIGTKEVWDSFLAKYPTGLYSDLARAQRAKIVAPSPPNLAKLGVPKPDKQAMPPREKGTRTAWSASCEQAYQTWRAQVGPSVAQNSDTGFVKRSIRKQGWGGCR